MISEDDIQIHCFARTMQRARQIASSNKNILTKQVRYHGAEAILSAFVASSHGWDDRYRTSITIDEDDDTIADYSCTCPSYYEYDGMCKHAAALALCFASHPQTFLGYQAVRTPSTTLSLFELMQRKKQQTFAEDAGSVDIEVGFSYGYGEWSAHFKLVGPQGSYVMKSISDFVWRMRTAERFSYGKKLTFAHLPSTFTENGKHIADFLIRAVGLREQAGAPTHWHYESREAVGRDLNLSDIELIELFDLMDNRMLTITGNDYGTRSITQAHLVESDPPIEVELLREDATGYHVSIERNLPFVAHGERMYLWRGETIHRCSPNFSRCADFLRAVAQDNSDELFISMADMPLFCATILPLLEQRFIMEIPSEVEKLRPVSCEVQFYFDKTKRGVECEAFALYANTRFPLFSSVKTPTPSTEEQPLGPLRDEAVEKRAQRVFLQFFSEANPCIELNQDDTIARLIFGGLARFQEVGSVFTTPAFDRLLTETPPHITVGLSLAGNLINLSVSSEDIPAKEVGALLASYRLKKRYHRLKNGSFLSLEDYDFAQLEHLAEDFGISSAQLASGSIEIPAYRAMYLDETLFNAHKDDSFMHYVENFRTVDEQSFQVPSSLAQILRPYQIDGYRWMRGLAERSFGGILADEMGLGKSIQLISFLLAYQKESLSTLPSLIVCPASLVYNWLAEIAQFAPDLKAVAIVGTKSERAVLRQTPGTDVFITSYDLLRIDAASFAEYEFFCCALDEAHYIKNHATKTARGVKRLRAQHRFALTGTPMENRLSELWSIFDFLMPGLLGTAMRFRERFELSILGGDKHAAERLRALVGPFMLRRLKSDVLEELPDKLEFCVYTQLVGEQKQLYVAHEQRLRISLTEQKSHKNKQGREQTYNERKVEILAELTKLRQICCDPRLLFENYSGYGAKLDAISELVETAMAAGEKMLVFSQFTSFLALIAERLESKNIPFYTITGATPKKKRLDLVNAFNADDTPVFLVSLKAGGTGLNLVGASVVIHADPWWNAAAQNQATDRAHRIGQENVVSVYRVIAKDTIEERILALQEAKSELANQVIGTGGVSLSSLSQAQLLDLLEG